MLVQHGAEIRRAVQAEIPQRYQALLSAEDVWQQTCVDAILDIRRFEPRGPGAFGAWLSTLARRNLQDALRGLMAEKRGGNRRQVQASDRDTSLRALYERLGGTGTTPSRKAAREEACLCLRRAIDRLPPAYREIVLMYDLQGYPVERVAARVRASLGAVFMRRARAHRQLRELLGAASLYFTDTA